MFANPLGLLALLALPAVVALHLFRRRFRPRVVSAVFLWEPKDRSSFSGRKRMPLRSSKSFWLELLAALLLALAVAGPRGCGVGVADHLVVVLDSSMSMSASQDEALDELDKRLRLLARRDRVTIVTSGRLPTTLVGPGALKAETDLTGWSPSAPRHDLGPAVDLATELASGGTVVLITDHYEEGAWPPQVEVVAVGQNRPNAGITHTSRVRAGDQDQIFVGVSAFGVRAERTLVAGEQRFDIVLEQATTETVSFLVDRDAVLELRLEPNDVLSADDVSWLAPLPPRTVGLQVELDESLERHLGLDRWDRLVPDSTTVEADGHVVVTTDPTDGGENSWVLVLGDEADQVSIGPFLRDSAHPVLDGVTLDGIIWTTSTLEPEGLPLVSAGNVPLMTEYADGGRRILTMDFQPWGSTLHRSPDWPILLLNLAEARRRALPGPRSTNLLVGEDFTWVGAEEGLWTVDEGDKPIPLAGRDLVLAAMSTPGVFELKKDGVVQTRIAVRALDAAESNLSGTDEGHSASQGTGDELEADLSGFDTALLLLVLLALGADWYVLRRGEQVLA